MFNALSTLDKYEWCALKCDMASQSENRTMQDVEREHIKGVLRMTKGNKREAARILKISRGTLYRRLKDYGLERLIRRPLDTLDDL